MSSLLHQVGVGNLYGLEDLILYGSLSIAYEERTATGLAFVLHHTAHANRAVEGSNKRLLIIYRQREEQFLLAERLHLLNARCRYFALQLLQISENLLLERYQNAGKNLLVEDSRLFQAVGHNVVDILDEYHISILLAQVGDERTMAARTEEQLTIGCAERFALHISSNGVG